MAAYQGAGGRLTDQAQDVRAAYGWLKAFSDSIPQGGNNLKRSYVDDYGRIHGALERALGRTLGDFDPKTVRVWFSGGDNWCNGDELRSKAMQLVGYLDYGFNVEAKTVEISSLFGAIHDQELRERCGDLIVGSGPFDRVINQATLVLEDRLRRRAGLDRTLVGPNLVNAAIRPEPTESPLVFSEIRAEQEGYASIIRGIMQALRNETHHTIVNDFSREDALSICGFIDRLLRLIEQSVIRR